MTVALAAADSLIHDAVEGESTAGAVLLVAIGGQVIHQKAFGYAQLYSFGGSRLEAPEPMTPEHLFDLASLTKVMATTFGIMLLVDGEEVNPDAPVSSYVPEFSGGFRDSVTIRHLLTHTSGLAPWLPTYYHVRTAGDALAYISGLPAAYGVGTERRYSDLGFMLLGYVIERVSRQPLDIFLRERLFRPLRLSATSFNPSERGLGPVAATSHGNPYERRMVADDDFGYLIEEEPGRFREWRTYTLHGEVNDGNAYYAHGGVAGHAGLFSTAADLKVLLDVLLDGGQFDGRRFISKDVIESFLSDNGFGNGLGWGLSRGVTGVEDAPPGTFGHRGFTGTQAVGVPAHGLSIVLLTNRQNVGVNDAGYYPDLSKLQREVAALIIGAASGETAAD
jgi:serine-type D-Ala-D-Ala carboxypeptidase